MGGNPREGSWFPWGRRPQKVSTSRSSWQLCIWARAFRKRRGRGQTLPHSPDLRNPQNQDTRGWQLTPQRQDWTQDITPARGGPVRGEKGMERAHMGGPRRCAARTQYRGRGRRLRVRWAVMGELQVSAAEGQEGASRWQRGNRCTPLVGQEPQSARPSCLPFLHFMAVSSQK